MAIEKSVLKSAITGHFDALRRQNMHVKEWDTTIYFDPITGHQRIKFNNIEDDFERFVTVLIDKVEDEDGKKQFTVADKPWLLANASTNLIQIIAQRILIADLVEVETLGKPSPPTKEA